MIVSMYLELNDRPGQLLLALAPISEFRGNIVSIVHHRDQRTPRGTIPVQVMFEIDGDELENVRKKMEDSGVRVVKVGEKRLHVSIPVILIGHVVHSDVSDTIDRIDRTGDAEVVNLSLSMPGIEKASAAYMVINATGEEALANALAVLRDAAKDKDLLVIEPVKNNAEET